MNTDVLKKLPLHFLLGFSRSGTSIVMSYLRGHPDVETGYEEPNALFRLLTALSWEGEYEEVLSVSKETIKKIEDDSIGLFTRFFYNSLCVETKKTTAILKHPWLNPYVRRLGEIFPKAKFVVLLRHPYDTLASTIDFRDTDRQAKMMFPEDLNALIDLYWRHIKSVMNAKTVLKDRILYVKFEDFLQTPGVVLGEMFEFYNVESNQDLVETIMNDAEAENLPLTARVLLTSKLIKPYNKWEGLNEEAKARIKNRLSPLLTKLGYDEK